MLVNWFIAKFVELQFHFYSPSCVGQEIAKGPRGFWVKMPPAQLSTTHGGDFTLSLFIAERQAGELRTPSFIVFGLTRPEIEPDSLASVADALSTRLLIRFVHCCCSAYLSSYCHPTATDANYIERSGHFLLQWRLRAWRNPHLLRIFEGSNVFVVFFEFLQTEFAACSKPPNWCNHRKASYPRTLQHGQCAGWTQITRSLSS